MASRYRRRVRTPKAQLQSESDTWLSQSKGKHFTAASAQGDFATALPFFADLSMVR